MNECKHEYKEVKYQEQEAVVRHWNYLDHHLTTLVHERVKIFCIHCGCVKQLDETNIQALDPQ